MVGTWKEMEESTTLIDKEERSRIRSGGKKKLLNKEECIAHKMHNLYRFFRVIILEFFNLQKNEIIKKWRIRC